MYILPNEIIYIINNYLLLWDIINLYSSHKLLYNVYKESKLISDIKNNIHSNAILEKNYYFFSPHRKKLFSKYFYKNIPKKINSIFDYIQWAYVFHRSFTYYNISFFSDNIILFTSNGTYNIFSICKNISASIKKKSNNFNKPKYILNQLAKERNLTALSKNWYHQLEYSQLCDLAYEIMFNI